MDAIVRGESRRGRPDAAAEWASTHDRGRDAATFWMVWQRRVLAAAVPHAHGPAVDESHRAAGAGRVEGRGRGPAPRVEHAPRAGETGGVSGARLHHHAAELPGRDGRERRDADQSAAAPGRGGVPAPHRVRQRGQPAAGPRHRARARDGGPDVDRRRPAPAAAAASHRERSALPRRRPPGGALRLRRDSLHRRADARVLRSQRVARRHQHPCASFFARRVAADGHRLRSRAGAADVEDGCHRRAQDRPQRRCRHARRRHPKPAGRDRSRVVGRTARLRGLDRAHLSCPAKYGHRHPGGSRADRERSAAAGQVHDDRTAQPLWAGTAGPRWRAARRRGRDVRPAVRRAAITVHHRRAAL